MLRLLPRFLVVFLVLVGGTALAQKVADLPIPTTYVNDFAHVLTPEAQRSLEDLCLEVHQQAGAELEVVTIKQLEDGQTIEQFSADLEEKWKIGKKGEDRSALIVRVEDPKHFRVETGYGLEGILNDAKVGRILDQAEPAADSGDDGQALLVVVQGLADVIATDRGVTLTPIVHTYHQQQAPLTIGPAQIVGGIVILIIFLILVRTGHLGWAIWFLLNMLGNGGGGGGGGGRDDDRGGGGFGGVGGGGSGGGGASRDF